MLDKFTHTNSKGEILDFFEYGIFINKNDLRDYEWKSQTNNKGNITGFTRGVTKKKLPLVFCLDNNRADDIKNAFYEHFDCDVVNAKYGYFTVNDFKYYCYITKSTKDKYYIVNNYLIVNLEITTDRPFWIKETTRTIDFSNITEQADGLKYPFKYPFKYGVSAVVVQNNHFAPCDGIIRIFGEAVNPLVKIGDNVYQVNTQLTTNEYLEINTSNKTITKIGNLGEKTNLFNYRNKKYDIFNKIPDGAVNVMANGKFKVDIVIEEKRSEPLWNSSERITSTKSWVTYTML